MRVMVAHYGNPRKGNGYNMKKIIGKIAIVLMSVVLLWIFASFVEANCKNLGENPTYCPANFFVIMTKISK